MDFLLFSGYSVWTHDLGRLTDEEYHFADNISGTMTILHDVVVSRRQNFHEDLQVYYGKVAKLAFDRRRRPNADFAQRTDANKQYPTAERQQAKV